MNGMPPNNPLTIAKESMQMSKDSGDRTFRLVALVMMAATGLGVLAQAAHMLWRDMRDERRYRRANARWCPPEDVPDREAPNRAELPSRQEEPAPERRWTGRTESARRTPEGEEQWTAYSGHKGHMRQR